MVPCVICQPLNIQYDPPDPSSSRLTWHVVVVDGDAVRRSSAWITPANKQIPSSSLHYSYSLLDLD